MTLQGPFRANSAGRETEPRARRVGQKLSGDAWVGPGLRINRRQQVEVDAAEALALLQPRAVSELGEPDSATTTGAKLNELISALKAVGVIR